MLCSMSTTYPSDLSDAEWGPLQCYLPLPFRQGQPRTWLSVHALANDRCHVAYTAFFVSYGFGPD
jgi:hypothetical protein